ncbi:hypothetical protein GCM10028856_39760 [Halopiger thermotolerans]
MKYASPAVAVGGFRFDRPFETFDPDESLEAPPREGARTAQASVASSRAFVYRTRETVDELIPALLRDSTETERALFRERDFARERTVTDRA